MSWVYKLERALRGEEIVGSLRTLSHEMGFELEYLPVTVAYAGMRKSVSRIYTGLSIKKNGKCFVVKAPDGSDLKDRQIYKEVMIMGKSSEDIVEEILSQIPEGLDRSIQKRSEEVKTLKAEYSPPPAGDLTKSFRVLVVYQGYYGERILNHLRSAAPPHWSIESRRLETMLPEIIDDPSEYLPRDLTEADLVVFLSEEGSAPQLIPDIVKAARARGVIAPVDNSSWMPQGQITQIRRLLDTWGVAYAFPRPFCSLEEHTSLVIMEFIKVFGKPSITITSDDGKTVTNVTVHRGSPCGCTEYVADNIKGEKLDEIVERAGLLHHHYPCLASMDREEDLGDTLMHVSGLITKQCVEAEVKKYIKKKVNYLDPKQFRKG